MNHHERLSYDEAWREAHEEEYRRLGAEAFILAENLKSDPSLQRISDSEIEFKTDDYEKFMSGPTFAERAQLHNEKIDEKRVELSSKESKRWTIKRFLEMTDDQWEFTSKSAKSRTEKPDEYPDRLHLNPYEAVYLRGVMPRYNPPHYTAPKILENAKGYADPDSANGEPFPQGYFDDRRSYVDDTRTYEGRHGGKLSIDYVEGYGYVPDNPMTLTGLRGRGVLGKWGPNFAADPIISRDNPETGELEVAMILRDNGEWAIPGGMVDAGEDVSRTIEREFEEEAGVALDMSNAQLVYRGYVDDPRNTDNAWMETTAKHLHLDDETAVKIRLEAGSDARAVRWMPVTDENLAHLFASHESMIRAALAQHVHSEKIDK